MRIDRRGALRVAAWAWAGGFAGVAARGADGTVLAVRGATVHTMAGPAIADGVVVIRDGKVAAVGPAAQVAIPAGARVLTAAVVTPGLVDAHTVVGLTGYLNQEQD